MKKIIYFVYNTNQLKTITTIYSKVIQNNFSLSSYDFYFWNLNAITQKTLKFFNKAHIFFKTQKHIKCSSIEPVLLRLSMLNLQHLMLHFEKLTQMCLFP